MVDTSVVLVHDTLLRVDTVIQHTFDTLFTVAPTTRNWWDNLVNGATTMISAISLWVAFKVFRSQKHKDELDAKASRYQALSQQPHLAIKEKILIGADDGDGIHLRLWNNGLGAARLTNVLMKWDGEEIRDIGSLASSQTIEVTRQDVNVHIHFALFELKKGQAIDANEGFRLLEVFAGKSYRSYIANFAKFELGIRQHLVIEIEYESLFGIKGEKISFPQDRTDSIIDMRNYAPDVPEEA